MAKSRIVQHKSVTAPVSERHVRLRVNGHEHTRTVNVRTTLVDFLREELGLTGTHVGCEHGVCGACTVLLNGDAVRSCLLFAVQAEGADISTVEGLGTPEQLHPLQEAFRDHHGLQCGFCTPGFLMTSIAFLRETPDPTDEQIRDVLSGNLCRCTGYQGIVEAVRDAAQRLRTQGLGPGAWKDQTPRSK
ncbi:MAG TPA: (2Fe-2S)-binding protein [bacterium]|jgi:carbon-monoxide dehydrogenase small subunit